MIHLVPVVHSQTMSKHDQRQYMRWICEVLQLDKKKSKDERVYCSYCDMNNHPRFSCKFYLQAPGGNTPSTHAHCAWPTMRLSNALELKSMVELPNQIGQEERRNLHSVRIKSQTFDGMAMFFHLHFHLQSKHHLKKDSSRLHKSNNFVQQQS